MMPSMAGLCSHMLSTGLIRRRCIIRDWEFCLGAMMGHIRIGFAVRIWKAEYLIRKSWIQSSHMFPKGTGKMRSDMRI